MAYVTNYKNDIFVSYAHVDDEPLPGADEGWVTTLMKGIKTRLAQRLGRSDAYALWMDHDLARHVKITDQIMDTIQQTALLVVVLSPGYVASEWCQREKETFLNLIKERVRSGSRVFIIERDMIEDTYRPPEFDELKGYRFWVKEREGKPPRILGMPRPNPDDYRYYDLLTDISYDLADELQRLKAASEIDEAIQKDPSAIVADGPQGKPITTEGISKQKIEAIDFDVFLCHNDGDKPEVRKIGKRLKNGGLLPWLDEWELGPGLPWHNRLKEQIKKIKTVAVFVGSDGVGPWQQPELEAILQEFVKQGCPVIPVLLSTAAQMPELPISLRGTSWVDFRKLESDPMGQLIRGITEGQSAEIRPTVFLAEVTDDLEPQRDNVKRYLDQQGMDILPANLYPRDAAQFQEAVDRDLARCMLFVQLLSGVVGKKPSGTSMTYARLQYERAQHASKPILQWRSRDLDISTSADADHKALLGLNTVLAVGIEEFKREIQKRAFYRPPSREPVHAFVFVNMEASDRSMADAVCKVLDQHGAEYILPLQGGKASDIREDLEQNLLDCDGVIVIYGCTTVKWVREQLRQCRKILAKRERPLKALAVFEGPPEEKVPLDLRLQNMQILDCRKGINDFVLNTYLKSL
jgi:hypothetical protein